MPETDDGAQITKQVITLVPSGFRDVYWCCILNEPVITTYVHGPQGNALFCRGCNWVCPSETPDEPFLSMHTFCCHICKP